MIKKNFEYIILGLILVLFVQGFFEGPEGVSENEVQYRIKISELTSEKIELMQKNNHLETKINTFKDEKNKIDSIVDGYSVNQIDSFYTNYFK